MFNSEMLFTEIDGRFGYSGDRHIQGEFKRFELVLDSSRIITDEEILYITTSDRLKDLVKRIPEKTDLAFRFLVSGDFDLSDLRSRPGIAFDQLDVSLDELVNIAAFIGSGSSAVPPQNDNRFVSAFLSDLVEGHLKGNEEILASLKGSPVKLLPHVSLIVVEARTPAEDMPVSVTGDFAACFPNSLVAYHKGDILILAQKIALEDKMPYNASGFEGLLKYHDAIAIQGRFTKWLTNMRQSYRRAKHGLRFARAFGDPERRFFNTEEYAYYEKIDLCAKYVKDYSYGDAHHLCCPAALLLDEYDSEHGTDYCSILAAFIDCDRNLSLTAEKLFYNRNTLKAKLEKIDDIAQESNFALDLDDPLKRYDMRFSLYMIQYIKNFMNRSTPYSAKERVPSTSEQLEN